MTCKISVIIPLYNDEAHIVRCLESVCSQTIADQLEVIIVDDGSTDFSIDLAKETLDEHSMMAQSKLIILDSNHGVANARRLAIKSSTGDYIMSCDSDDWMDVTMCEKLLCKAESDNCDVVVCDYNSIRDGVVTPVDSCYKEPFLSHLLLCSVTGSLWNKLIRSDILKTSGFVYPAHDFSEDYVYSVQVAVSARKIGYVSEPLYNYLKRPDSLVRLQRPDCCAKRERDDEENYKLVLSILEKAKLSQQYKEELIFHKLRRKNHYKNDLKKWRTIYPELNRDIFRSHFVSFRSRIAYFLTFCGLYRE